MVFFVFFLSDGCQTHRWCTFFCARSNSVYSTTRCSGSQCLHVCPWWKDNVSGRFVPLWEENTGVSPDTMCHGRLSAFHGRCLLFFAELPRGIRRKSNTMQVAPRPVGGERIQVLLRPPNGGPYQGDLQHVQLNPLL